MDPKPAPEKPQPKVDERLVEAETSRDEMVRGRRVVAMPANPPHADRHCQVDYVIRAHTAEGYVTSSDLLTRVGPGSDFATDTSVRRAGIDPSTDARYLEELAFEVVSEQSLRDITERAEDLARRGVRRLIAIFVKTGAVREWSRERNEWVSLPLEGVLDDPTLVRPVAIRALLDAAAADDEVVDALVAKGNQRLVQRDAEQREAGLRAGREAGLRAGREAGQQAGQKAGLVRAIGVACKLLDLPFGPREQAQLEQLDLAATEAWLARIEAERRWPD